MLPSEYEGLKKTDGGGEGGMKRFIIISGTLLITMAILISGSAVALTWHYIQSVQRSLYCTNPFDARYRENGKHATIGENFPAVRLGYIILDLGEGNEMGANQLFTVFHNSVTPEAYKFWLHDDGVHSSDVYEWWDDTADKNFSTPSTPNRLWRFIEIHGLSGDTSDDDDPIYGPEIDAVGWYEP